MFLRKYRTISQVDKTQTILAIIRDPDKVAQEEEYKILIRTKIVLRIQLQDWIRKKITLRTNSR